MSNNGRDGSDQNGFCFTGELCSTPTKTMKPSGKYELTFHVHTVQSWHDKDGNRCEDAADVPIKLYGKAAEKFTEANIQAGSRVEVTGRIGAYVWPKDIGVPRLQLARVEVKRVDTVLTRELPDAMPKVETPKDRSPQPAPVDTTNTAGDDVLPF